MKPRHVSISAQRVPRAMMSDVGRGHSDQVQSYFPQRRLTGQRLQEGDGLQEGLSVVHLLLCPRQSDLQRRKRRVRGFFTSVYYWATDTDQVTGRSQVTLCMTNTDC